MTIRNFINLVEGPFSNTKADFGVVPFSSTSETDSHVQKIVQIALAQLKEAGVDITQEKLWKTILDDKDLLFVKEAAKKSPILYETIAKNAIEQSVFKLMKNIKVPEAPKFKWAYFKYIINYVRSTHKSMFPLRNFVKKKYLKNPNFILLPSKDFPELNSCDTACATPDGKFAFNVDFMQQLMNYAHLKGIKPKGKIYANNGGQVPDEYGYLEFLIMHELMHYTNADFYYQKLLKGNNKIINYVGDFRSNYELVKNGYDQLPIGLFSDHINYDRQNSYKEMYDLVAEEMKKFQPPQQEQLQDLLDKLAGGEHNDGEPEESNGDPGDDADGPMGDPIEEIDKAAKETSDNLKKGKEKKDSGSDDVEDSEEEGNGNKGKPDQKGSRGKGTGALKDTEQKIVEPKVNWKELMRKMFASAAKTETEDTYAKVHRSSAARIGAAASTGRPSSLKAGEKEIQIDLLKVAFIVDTSGSMWGHQSAIHANIKSCFAAQSGGQIAPYFLLMQFSSGAKYYAVDAKANKGVEATIQEFLQGKKIKSATKTMDQVLMKGEGGATNFTSDMVDKIQELFAAGFNVMMFSDSDVASGPNLDTVKAVTKAGAGKFFLIMADLDDYNQIRRNWPTIPLNVSCLN